jgi:hypothetical protein
VIKDVPDAVADLDTYQSNREKIQELRYVGGAGLLLLVGGYILSKSLDEGNSYDRKGLIFGGGLAVLGFGSGLILNSRNEKNIESAIQKYNQSRPNDPIQFEITTGAGF